MDIEAGTVKTVVKNLLEEIGKMYLRDAKSQVYEAYETLGGLQVMFW